MVKCQCGWALPRLEYVHVLFPRSFPPSRPSDTTCTVSDVLKAGPTANPPYNLRKQLILHAAFALSIVPLVLCMRGKQVRREMDEKENIRDLQAEADREAHDA